MRNKPTGNVKGVVSPMIWRLIASNVAALILILPTPAFAQVAGQIDALAQEAGLAWTGDLQLRYDHLSRAEPVERSRDRLRVGVRHFIDAWEIGFVGEASFGSDSDRDNRKNGDNERSNDVNLDEAYIRWSPSDHVILSAGKTKLPVKLSPMLWDEDLRPVGLSATSDIAIGSFDRLSLTAGWFKGDHLYGDQTRIALAQATWYWHEGAVVSYAAALGYVGFDGLSGLVGEGLARTNGVSTGELFANARLVDLQLEIRHGHERWPVRLDVDVVRNVGARVENDGARISLIAGDGRRRRGVELGLAYERIQSNAVVAAFNSDDWWFHGAMRGFMPWVAYGFSDIWSVRATGSIERRDGAAQDVERLLIDFRAAW